MHTPGASQEDPAPHGQAVLEQVELMYQRYKAGGLLDAQRLFLLGELCASAGLHARAIQFFSECVELIPSEPAVHHARGRSLLAAGRPVEAEGALRACLALGPERPDAHHLLGVALQWQGRLEEALSSQQEATRRQPGHSKAQFNEAILCLQLGRSKLGWRKYQHRLRLDNGLGVARLPTPRWFGKAPLSGRRLLVYAEEGLGDCVQYLRYLPLLAGRGGRLLLQVPGPLVSLVRTAGFADEVFTAGQAVPDHDFHCPIGSLPYVFDGRIPGPEAYLKVPAGPVISRDGSLKVGLVWAGQPLYSQDAQRSIDISNYETLLSVQGCRFVSLQKELRAGNEAWLQQHPEILRMETCMGDFQETAALITGLDLVITVDTAVAHLAGALGKPVWILLSKVHDWRWQTGRKDSPWYRSARLFIQEQAGSWGPVIAEVRARLELMQLERAGGTFPCRPGCGACCIAPSISSPIPPRAGSCGGGVSDSKPVGKAAGVPCPQLDDDLRCLLFGKPGRPTVCGSLKPCLEMCGMSREEALAYLSSLEQETQGG